MNRGDDAVVVIRPVSDQQDLRFLIAQPSRLAIHIGDIKTDLPQVLGLIVDQARIDRVFFGLLPDPAQEQTGAGHRRGILTVMPVADRGRQPALINHIAAGLPDLIIVRTPVLIQDDRAGSVIAFPISKLPDGLHVLLGADGESY